MPEIELDRPKYAAVGLICAMLGGLFGAVMVRACDEPAKPTAPKIDPYKLADALSRLRSVVTGLADSVSNLRSRVETLERD